MQLSLTWVGDGTEAGSVGDAEPGTLDDTKQVFTLVEVTSATGIKCGKNIETKFSSNKYDPILISIAQGDCDHPKAKISLSDWRGGELANSIIDTVDNKTGETIIPSENKESLGDEMAGATKNEVLGFRNSILLGGIFFLIGLLIIFLRQIKQRKCKIGKMGNLLLFFIVGAVIFFGFNKYVSAAMCPLSVQLESVSWDGDSKIYDSAPGVNPAVFSDWVGDNNGPGSNNWNRESREDRRFQVRAKLLDSSGKLSSVGIAMESYGADNENYWNVHDGYAENTTSGATVGNWSEWVGDNDVLGRGVNNWNRENREDHGYMIRLKLTDPEKKLTPDSWLAVDAITTTCGSSSCWARQVRYGYVDNWTGWAGDYDNSLRDKDYRFKMGLALDCEIACLSTGCAASNTICNGVAYNDNCGNSCGTGTMTLAPNLPIPETTIGDYCLNVSKTDDCGVSHQGTGDDSWTPNCAHSPPDIACNTSNCGRTQHEKPLCVETQNCLSDIGGTFLRAERSTSTVEECGIASSCTTLETLCPGCTMKIKSQGWMEVAP